MTHTNTFPGNRESARERRLIFQDRTPLGREILNKTNAEAVLREAQESLSRLASNIDMARKVRFEDRQRVMEDMRSHLQDIRLQITPAAGTTSADLVPHQEQLRKVSAQREELEKQVNDHISRIQDLTRNGVHRFLTENPVVTGFGSVLSTTFGGLFSTMRDIGTIVQPTVEAMWRPVESAGSTVLNFLAGAVGRLNPQIGEQLRARATLVLQQEQLMKAFASAAGRITGRGISPVESDEDRNARIELQQIQQRSGRDVQSFATLTLQQFSRLPISPPLPPPGGAINMTLLVRMAELAFPVGAPTTAPLTTVPPVTVNDALNASSPDITANAGGSVTLTLAAGSGLDCALQSGTNSLAATAGATMNVAAGGGTVTFTRVSATSITIQLPATIAAAATLDFSLGGNGGRATKNFTLRMMPRTTP